MNRLSQTSILVLILIISSTHETRACQSTKSFNGFRAQPSQTPRAATQIIEGENAKRTVNGGNLSVQDMRSFGKWSGNKQLFWNGGQVRHRLDFQFSKPAAAWEPVVLFLTKAPDFANLRFQWNGRELKNGFDGYSPTVKLAKKSLGPLDFKSGVNTLSLVIVGKNPKSSNFRVGVDRIDIGSRPVTTMMPNLKAQSKQKLAFNPNLFSGPSNKGKKPTSKPNESSQSKPNNPNMHIFNMAQIYAPGVELFFYRGGSPEFAYSLDPTEVKPNSPDKRVDFAWNADNLPSATAVMWQVSKHKIPAYTNSKQVLRPAGIVGSGYASAPNGLQRGNFKIDFSPFANQLPTVGDSFYVRVIPVENATTQKIVGQSSRPIRVYWGNQPKTEITMYEAHLPQTTAPAPPSKQKVTIQLQYLSCSKANEYDRNDISISANRGPGDEPYLRGNFFAGKSLQDLKLQPIKRDFANIKNNRGNHWIGESATFEIGDKDFIGFYTELWEWDESDAPSRYKGLETAGGVITAGAGVIATKGAALKDPQVLSNMFKVGAEAIGAFNKFLAQIDGDDFIDTEVLVFNRAMLKHAMQEWKYGRELAARGVNADGTSSYLNSRGEQMKNAILKPWFLPGKAERIELKYRLEFDSKEGTYEMQFAVFVANPWRDR